MNEGHQRFQDWLIAGADGDPPRDLAVHASVCAACQRSIAAHDQLGIVNTGAALMPGAPTGRERSRLLLAGRLAGATAVLFGATILGVGVSQLVGVSHHDDGPVGQVTSTPSPNQGVLGETATPQPSPSPSLEATPSVAQETLTPLGTPLPTHAPVATPVPRRTPAPTPQPTAPPTPPPTPVPTPVVTAPGAPSALTASPGSPEGVQLSWAAPTTDGGSPITGFRIYRGDASGAEVFVTEVSPSVGYLDLATTPQGTYWYLVTAVNATGESAFSNEASATSP